MSHSHIISKQRIKKLLRGGDQKTNKKKILYIPKHSYSEDLWYIYAMPHWKGEKKIAQMISAILYTS